MAHILYLLEHPDSAVTGFENKILAGQYFETLLNSAVVMPDETE
jgi:hypothetical protein